MWTVARHFFYFLIARPGGGLPVGPDIDRRLIIVDRGLFDDRDPSDTLWIRDSDVTPAGS